MQYPRLPIVLVILSLFGVLVPVRAQQPAATPKTPAHEVILPVSVSNKRGEPITDLAADSLALTDNGKPQTITSLTPGSDVPLQVGILMDTSLAMSRSLEAERKAAENFVNLILPADPSNAKNGNRAFLIHFDKEVELLEDFTNSRTTLDNDIEQMGPTSAANSSAGADTTGGNGRKPRVRGEGADLYDAIYLASHEVMKSVKGLKVLVVFSQGTDLNSKEALNDAIDAAERANTLVYTIYFRGDEESLRMGRGVGNSYPPMYPGGYPYPDPGGYPGGYPYPDPYPGGGGGGPSGVPPINGKRNLADIASRTGGRNFEAKRIGELDSIYNQIAADLHGQYLLTYTPNPLDADGTFHKTALTAKKGDVIVTLPEGYYAPGSN